MSSGPLTSSCACGAVTVTVPGRPDYINDCNCTLCTKLGASWAYYPPQDVVLNDEAGLEGFRRTDLRKQYLQTFRCRTCGCVTHWRSLEPLDPPRSGVNVQLFEPDALAGIEVRRIDGRSWRA